MLYLFVWLAGWATPENLFGMKCKVKHCTCLDIFWIKMGGAERAQERAQGRAQGRAQERAQERTKERAQQRAQQRAQEQAQARAQAKAQVRASKQAGMQGIQSEPFPVTCHPKMDFKHNF